MSFELFIAKRIIAAKQYKSSISSPIVKIAIFAIALGVVMMLIAVAAGLGLQQKIQEKVSAFNGNVIVSKYDNNQSEVSAAPISLQQDFYIRQNEFPEVSHIQAVAYKAGVIRTQDNFEGIHLKGVGPDFDGSYFKKWLVEGRLPEVSKARETNEILLSRYLANRLELALGSTAVAYFPKENLSKTPNRRNFKVVGIYDSGFQDFDKNRVVADIRHIQRINKWKKNLDGKYTQVGVFEVFINDFSRVDEFTEQLYENTDSFLQVASIKEKYPSIFEWLQVFDFNIYLIIGVMILISVINMSVMLLVLILEQTNLIGVLKALGSNNWSVRKVFLYNAAYIVIVGLFWGNAIGLSFLHLQDYFGFLEFPNPEAYYVKKIPVQINYLYVVLLNLATFCICFLMLIIPSVIITKISPIKAIKFQ